MAQDSISLLPYLTHTREACADAAPPRRAAVIVWVSGGKSKGATVAAIAADGRKVVSLTWQSLMPNLASGSEVCAPRAALPQPSYSYLYLILPHAHR